MSLLENSLIVIDEVHKLTVPQMQLISRKINLTRYTKKPKVILMSATPFESINHEKFIAKIFTRNNSPSTTKSEIIKYSKGKVSYYDPSKDSRYFPVPITMIKTIPVVIPNFKQCKDREVQELLHVDSSNLNRQEKYQARIRVRGRKKDCLEINDNPIATIFRNHRYKTDRN